MQEMTGRNKLGAGYHLTSTQSVELHDHKPTTQEFLPNNGFRGEGGRWWYNICRRIDGRISNNTKKSDDIKLRGGDASQIIIVFYEKGGEWRFV